MRTKTEFEAPSYNAAKRFVQKIVDRGGIWCKAHEGFNRFFVPLHRIEEIVFHGEAPHKTKLMPAK
jgi:hypothetical protein